MPSIPILLPVADQFGRPRQHQGRANGFSAPRIVPTFWVCGNMSLPPEALHQLISGYIDGVLSDDEATRLRDLLREDPSVAALLQGFQTNRAAMRQLGDRIVAAGNVSSGQNGLSSEFAQRVVTAAFDAAAPNAGQVDRERRAVADSTRNRDSASSRDRSSLVRYQFASFALLAAAAVAAVIFIPPWMRGNIGEQGNGQQQDIAAANNSLNDDRTRDIDVEETINADNDSRIAAAENSASAQQGVAADATANSALSGDDTPKVSTNPGTSSVNDGTMLAGNEKELIDGSQIASSEQPAMVDPAAAKTDAVTDDSADESTPQMLRMLFVVHVKLTDEGRESQAIEGLMRSVGIDSGGQHRVGNEVMDSLKRQNLVSANP
ncbi:MAG: hypothetical protein AAFN70_13120, partial [Planctomycetota bacterium]